MRFLRKSLTGLFLVSVTLGLMAYAGIMVRDAVLARMAAEARVPQARERVFAVNVLPVTFETVTPVLTSFGEVQSRRTLEIRAASSGAVVELDPAFVEGGQVTAGQVLARIDPADAQAALDRAESDLLDASAEVREAERALEIARDELSAAEEQVVLRETALRRQRDLLDRNVGTAAAVETAELALASERQSVLTRRQAVATAEARIDQAATQLRRAEIARDEAQRRLDDTEIRAQFGGTLSDVTVVAGRLVSTNEQLAQLVDPQALEVAFRVSTQQYARLLDGDGGIRQAPVTATLDFFGTNISAQGRISRDGAAVGAGQTGRQLFATLDAPRGFKPGDFVTVTINEPQLDGVARLPATALNAADEVLVVGADERLEVVQVQLMRRQGDDVLIRGADLRGREVVAQRTPLLGAGIKVKPLRTGVAPEPPAMVELTEERRARLKAFIEANTRMPEAAKSRILSQLDQQQVPAEVVERIESRMGG
ncbi:efflux RND transporter periplasmic adaptor subunit [Mameliella sediminis]|uniref:efflux RND transporter periplasmic adaptor subunit n=1 Tax=Mameliella sediminis TaxID=2836866 RepID=UPI001C44E116|nr:HlyD family efflux transporter periplasmic adaptor subunit [Mameliella sediminis]MBY6113427.1 HlyD family efflux transporter periplasmic adaptor subunit [Antarctobacter heliothermus]MBY6143225.1 HlyD family efflux transporter periplasmic adaptor subunit [Mameliella alba]MBV7394725.1 HlyD family efflux transporter periplasmic adaptor subunit [Mameliella sediminis]MBY6163174.1 HlyD family efflux transporter periplasmic adaptor subunit [Mameliella alba]MBY6171438.1 HlyD family efflux transport